MRENKTRSEPRRRRMSMAAERRWKNFISYMSRNLCHRLTATAVLLLSNLTPGCIATGVAAAAVEHAGEIGQVCG